jgi:hypothetical protein
MRFPKGLAEVNKHGGRRWKMAENDGEGLKLYLKKRCPNCSGANVEIVIESETVKKTERGYECNPDDYKKIYNRIDNFNENEFEIIALGYTLNIPYKKLDYWQPDECNPNKIHLCLKKDVAIVLYADEKLELENLQ